MTCGMCHDLSKRPGKQPSYASSTRKSASQPALTHPLINTAAPKLNTNERVSLLKAHAIITPLLRCLVPKDPYLISHPSTAPHHAHQSSLTPQKSVPTKQSTRHQNPQYHPLRAGSHLPSSVRTGPSPIQSWLLLSLVVMVVLAAGLVTATNQDTIGIWRRMRVVREGWGRRASEMGRSGVRRMVGMAVM